MSVNDTTQRPKPVQWATYNGDCSDAIGEVMGPNTLGEKLQVVAADYDADTGKTRLGFSYIITPGLS